MNPPLISIAFLVAYLIGSIPTAVWVGQAYFGIDIREHGSKNAGATNTFRVLGRKAGIFVLIIDILKGWTASCLASILLDMNLIEVQYLVFFKIALGFMAVIGHLFPVFTWFKGGKGVATFFGVILCVTSKTALACSLLFLVILILSNYVSLSSILSSICFFSLQFFSYFNPEGTLLIIFGLVVFLIILLTHRKNISRLLHGQENKIYFFPNKIKG